MQFSGLVLWAGHKTIGERKGAKVDTGLLVMKLLSVRWITSAYDYIRSESGMVRGGFLEAGIVDTLDKDEADSEQQSDDDPFEDLD